MPESRARRVAYFITLLAPGLYAARLLCEWLRPGAALTAILSIFVAVGGAYLLHRLTARRPIWLVLPLYAYVFYPVASPSFALASAAVCVIAIYLANEDRLPYRFDAVAPRLLASLVFLLSLVFYAWTLAPGLLPADNGELQVVAARLGVAHPPGFALYTVLAHLATRLPLGPDPAYRVNLLSAVIAAATLALVFLSAFRLTHSHRASFVGVAALGGATTFWSQATTANVRVLAAFFCALALYLLLLYRQQLTTDAARERPARSPRFSTPSGTLFLFSLILSLGVTHHASLAFMFVVFALALLSLDPGLARRPRAWLVALAGLLLGLLPLLYFPLRALTASETVRGVSASLATLPGFLQHVLALGFRGDLFAYVQPQELWARLQTMGNVMTFQFHWLLLAGMLLGFYLLLRAQPRLALALGIAFALHTLVTATYRAPQTVEYMLPAYVPVVLLLAFAAAPPLAYHVVPPRATRHISALLAAVFLVAALAQALQRHASFEQLSHDHTAREVAAALLQQAPPDSVILADWHWATPLWYLQEVEGRRPDLSIHYVFPTAEPYGETWARRIAENLALGRSVVATHRDRAAYSALPASEPLGDAFLFVPEPRTALPASFTPLAQALGERIELLGYHLETDSVEPLHEGVLTLAWRPASEDAILDLTLFVHLVSKENGAIFAQHDAPAPTMSQGISLTRLHFTSRLATAPGAYRLFVGAYESLSGQPLLNADGETRTLLQDLSVEAMSSAPATAHPVTGSPDADGRQLVGYDWDHTLAPHTRLYLHWRTPRGYITQAIDDPAPAAQLPQIYGPWGFTRRLPPALQFYVPLGLGIVWTGAPQLAGQTLAPGATLALTQHFLAGRPLQSDLVASVRLVGYEADGVHWAWWDLHDGVPALGAIPTLKWISGSRIRDPHFLTVASDAPSGQSLGALLTLYDAFTQRPLPILDERITSQYLGIPLGTGQVR